ncbi:MAG: hypothetical protein V4732_08000 [Pseudomonadota bacterium]
MFKHFKPTHDTYVIPINYDQNANLCEVANVVEDIPTNLFVDQAIEFQLYRKDSTKGKYYLFLTCSMHNPPNLNPFSENGGPCVLEFAQPVEKKDKDYLLCSTTIRNWGLGVELNGLMHTHIIYFPDKGIPVISGYGNPSQANPPIYIPRFSIKPA